MLVVQSLVGDTLAVHMSEASASQYWLDQLTPSLGSLTCAEMHYPGRRSFLNVGRVL